MPALADRLATIRSTPDCAHIDKLTCGLEKESLRVTPEGVLAATAHPDALGASLTHPQITTDYSEALLEFITPPGSGAQALIDQLDELHRLTYRHIGEEFLWVNSMPCVITRDDAIPIAQYGRSNNGRMKMVYRQGLGHRYGRSMQIIAGIHFNFSVADHFWEYLRRQDKSPLDLRDYKTEGYFKLIRNFRRYFWLLLYLYGASPSVCRSFVQQRQHQLIPVGDDRLSLYTPHATSLRMGDLGYQSNAQQSLAITYNCLGSYSESLCRAITTPYPDYATTGIRDDQGEYRQLNDGLLQIENEFYSVIRPKRTTKSGQTPLTALNEGGVEYIEVRCLDLDPFEPVGINAGQIHFLDLFLLFCLLEESPESDTAECRQLQENQRRTVYRGRDPELRLYHYGRERAAREWGFDLIRQLQPLAHLLDGNNATDHYRQAIARETAKLENDQLTPSAKIVAELQSQNITFYQWAMNASRKSREYFLNRPLNQDRERYYAKMAALSRRQQRQLEAADQKNFETFLADYYRQYQCNATPKNTPTNHRPQ